jgi:hypothetical protein
MSNNEPIWKYDFHGNQIYYNNGNGFEWWREYDANENEIHYKDSNGIEEWYDSDGNVIDEEIND